MNDDKAGCAMLVIFVAAMLVVSFLACDWGRSIERERAVQAGVGRWTTDPKTGDTTFVYGVSR